MLKAKEMKEKAEVIHNKIFFNYFEIALNKVEKAIEYQTSKGKTCIYCPIEVLVNYNDISPADKHRLALMLRCEVQRYGYKCYYLDKRSWSTLAMSCGVGPSWKFYGLFISWGDDKIDKSKGYRKSWKIYDY